MWKRSYDNGAILYLIPTPIGNMEDITFRSLRILKEVDVVFSEDTRVTQNLFNYFEIQKKLVALHDHNENIVKDEVLAYLEQGCNVAIVTDRGTPIVSDPGYKTVSYVSKKGYSVVALPGACAFVPALIVSGINPQPFTFYGFLDSKIEKRKKELMQLKFVTNTLIFYEAPHRILQTMKLMLEIFGDREVSLSREITKKFESVYRGKISNLLPTLESIKGEFVIVVSGFEKNLADMECGIVEQVQFYIDNGMKKMEAIKIVAREREMKKNDVYALYHQEVEK
ncbi:MAG: 16S rRNA (cytidine(1402)-2'-O)-methyltransferase [Bacilli bacterium]|nr:16S rRNA (cytidine(1402)-2'-O)-methyltransferase [Bacilli bacterium]